MEGPKEIQQPVADPPVVEDPKPVDLNTLEGDKLEEALGNYEEPVDPPAEDPKPAEPKATDPPKVDPPVEDPKPAEPVAAKPGEEPKPTDPPVVDPPKETEVERLRRENKEQRATITKQSDASKELERKNLRNSFTKLDDAKKAELKRVSPEEYVDYIEEETKYDAEIAKVDQEEKQEFALKQHNHVLDFLGGHLSIELNDDAKQDLTNKLLDTNSAEHKLVKQVADVLETRFQPGKDGTYSAADFKLAMQTVDLPSTLKAAKQEGRETAITAMTNAADNATQPKLAGAEAHNLDEHGDKNLEDWSQAEFNKMDAEAVEKALKKAGAPGT